MKKNYLVLLSTAILSFYASAQLPTNVPSSGLVGWWPFNGNADDMGPNVYDGIVSGATSASDRFGTPGSAFSFDGVNDQISINTNNFGSGDFSISGWFKTGFVQDSNSYKQIFMAGYNNGNKVTEFAIVNWPSQNNNHRPVFNIREVFPNDISSYGPDSLNNDSWTHFVVIKKVGQIETYINGSLVSSTVSNVANVMDNDILVIGNGQGNVNNRWFNGLIDDIGIWNRALTVSEISSLSSMTTGVHTLTQQSFEIWPNPTNDFITIRNSDYSTQHTYTVKIYNAIGQEVYQSVLTKDNQSKSIKELGGSGVYFLSVVDENQVVVSSQKIVLN